MFKQPLLRRTPNKTGFRLFCFLQHKPSVSWHGKAAEALIPAPFTSVKILVCFPFRFPSSDDSCKLCKVVTPFKEWEMSQISNQNESTAAVWAAHTSPRTIDSPSTKTCWPSLFLSEKYISDVTPRQLEDLHQSFWPDAPDVLAMMNQPIVSRFPTARRFGICTSSANQSGNGNTASTKHFTAIEEPTAPSEKRPSRHQFLIRQTRWRKTKNETATHFIRKTVGKKRSTCAPSLCS